MKEISSENKLAVISISKALLGISFATIAALGGITGVGWLAIAAAMPDATLGASDSLAPFLQKLKGKKEEFIEIPVPPWWSNKDGSSWQDACNSLESRLPGIVNATAERLKRETNPPTSQVIFHVFTNEIERQTPKWDIDINEHGLMADSVVQPFFKKVADILKTQTDTIQLDALALKLEDVATKVTNLEIVAQTSHQVVQANTSAASPDQVVMDAPDTLQQKWLMGAYDVYICYHKDDIVAVKEIDKKLKAEGILPWFDMRKEPGITIQTEKSNLIRKIGAAAIFIGKSALTNWQVLDIESLINEFTKRQFLRVIPVFLAGAPEEPELSVFLENFTGVDFRQSEPDPFAYLMWGITDRRPSIL